MFFKKLHALATEEVIVSLSLIAFLLILMLGLHNVSGNNYKVATDKFLQTDLLLKKWAYTTKKVKLDNQAIIVNSIVQYLNKEANVKADIKNNEKILLNNGVDLSIKYVGNINTNLYFKPVFNDEKYNMNEKNIAVITAKTKSGHKYFTEEYILKASRLISLSNLYEGWNKYPIENIKNKNGEKLKVYCAGYKHCINGCNDENSCEKINSNGTHVYVNTIVLMPCRKGHTGNVVKLQTGTIEGVVETTVDRCCVEPQVYVGEKKKCACPENFKPDKGFVYNKDSLNCQTPISK